MTNNKNLLITGAATRVGKAIAIYFSERGWNIGLHYFRSSREAEKLKKIIEQNQVKVALIKADLKNPNQVEKIVPLAKKKLGNIECLINNAALLIKQSIVPNFFLANGIIFSICFIFFKSALIKTTLTHFFSIIFLRFFAFEDDLK